MRGKWIEERKSLSAPTTSPLFVQRQRKSKIKPGRSTQPAGAVPKRNGYFGFAAMVFFSIWFAPSPEHYCKSAADGLRLHGCRKSLPPRTAGLLGLHFQRTACT